MNNKFKVGDEVSIINRNNLSFSQKGIVEDIETVGTFSNFPNYRVRFCASVSKWFCESELELAKDDTAQEIDNKETNTEPKFKVDDKVRVIKSNRFRGAGEIGTIMAIDFKNRIYNAKFNTACEIGFYNNYNEHELELVKEETAKEHKFKVGDKVRVLKDSLNNRKVGEEGVVVEDSWRPYVNFESVDFLGSTRTAFNEDDLELVKDEDNKEVINNESKFKIGDKVKVLSDEVGIRKAGEEGIILRVEEGSMTTIYVVGFNTTDRDGDFDWRFYEDELELANESASTNIDELSEKTQQTIANFPYTLANPNQPLLDSFKELLNISNQLAEFNKINNTNLKIVVE